MRSSPKANSKTGTLKAKLLFLLGDSLLTSYLFFQNTFKNWYAIKDISNQINGKYIIKMIYKVVVDLPVCHLHRELL